MVASKYVPKRGDVVWIDFDPTKGHEQQGRRPGLVLSPEKYNRNTHLAIVCPITSKQKGYPLEVDYSGEEITGVILPNQIRSIDWTKRNVEFAESSDSRVGEEVLAKLLPLIQ